MPKKQFFGEGKMPKRYTSHVNNDGPSERFFARQERGIVTDVCNYQKCVLDQCLQALCRM
jgi:hypothetical protein